MKYKKGTRRQATEYEKDLVSYWKQHNTFEKSVAARPKNNAYVFYDGPPFITGIPHHGTLLTSIVKDAVPRYWTMKGKRVERVWGWDTHGLPAEVFTEKKLGIHDKRDIGTKVSLEDYINTCRENMIQTGSEWEDTIDRIGRWVDFKGAYKTMDKDYMESVWWAFKKLYDDGKIYEGEKVLLYCTRDATPISKAEVAMDNSYKDVTDPSVYIKFKLNDYTIHDHPVYLLAWTTTPWTLPANTAVGVGENEKYTEVLVDGQHLILVSAMVEKVLRDEKHQPLDYKIVRSDISGSELVGKSYEPLFNDRGYRAHLVWNYPDLVTTEGTGIVHLAPAYGEEDYALAKQQGFPFINVIDDNGFYSEGEWQGQYVWDANKPIAKELHERGIVWKIDYVTHSYPHCHRCGTKLMYRAHPSWFMDIAGQRELMLQQNGEVNWVPEHIKHGRSEKTIESAPDWNLSRDRFWATAMPVWKGKDNNGNERIKVIGSYSELHELSGITLEDYHRPWIDDVTFTIDGIEYKRIDKVLDCWFESGSMPFAQFHYPFENQEKFEHNFPGDFIVEYVPQVRAWFYYLSAVNNGLFGKVPFKTALVHGTLAGNDGRKMSKSFGNYTDPNELMDRFSADSLRFLFLSSPILNAEDFSLQDKDVGDVARKLSMVWNMYDFFTLYADVDNWDSGLKAGELPPDPMEELENPLDQWIVSRVHQLSQEVDEHMQRYDLPNALKPILPFVDDASNWYVRRSRKRFWKADSGPDKQQAYKTLHYVLVQLSLIMAPFTPFLAEELYQKLTGGESVHLLDWPEVGHINELLVRDMKNVRDAITAGLAERAKAGIKVRQPLASANIAAHMFTDAEARETTYSAIIAEELNVKKVLFNQTELKHQERMAQPPTEAMIKAVQDPIGVSLDTNVTPELKQEGLMREIIRNIQQARKQAGLEIDDHINLFLDSNSDEITTVLKNTQLTDIIQQETLVNSMQKVPEKAFSTTNKIEGHEITIQLAKP